MMFDLFKKLMLIVLFTAVGCSNQLPTVKDRWATTQPLPTGRAISLKAESDQHVGSMPINLVMSPHGRFVLSSDIGYYQALWSIRTSDGKGVSHVNFSNAVRAAARTSEATTRAGGEDTDQVTDPGSPRSNGLYYGIAISSDGLVYAGQGGHDSIAVLSFSDEGVLKLKDTIRAKATDFPAGVALDERGRLYLANNGVGHDNPLKTPGSLAIYDRNSKVELGRYTFTASHGGTSNFPYGVAALRDGSKAYLASERDDAVYVLDTHDPNKPTMLASLATGAHPLAVLLDRDQKHLFVSNSLSDTVSIIDTATDRIIATVLLRPKMARDLMGVTPIGLALSPDQDTLYAALGDMNAVAVIDVDDAELRGYISTGWYPSALAVTPDGKRLLVADAKGSSVRNPNNKPDPHDAKRKTVAALSVLEGNVVSINIPTGDDLKKSTQQVLEDNRLDELAEPTANPLASIGLSAGKLKHVIYVIKENRTYDQILGDEPKGNGDLSLVLFGKKITPNQHALADRFVLLDNLFACGEVSGDGWAWSTQGMADAYVVRNVPYSYSHRGRKFDFEAANNGYPTGGAPATLDGKPLSTSQPFLNGVPAVPDVANTGRNIWDAAREAGLSLRNYGFLLYFSDRNSGSPGGPDNYPAAIGLQPAGHDLAGLTDYDFRRFDLDYADSDAPSVFFKQTNDKRFLFKTAGYGKDQMPSRFSEWNREFQMMLARDPSGDGVPALTLVRMPTDHTSAARMGKHSPAGYVADNDYAVGQLVDAVSHSPIWKNTAICVIEDDAQSGVDHVDSHRTTAYIISPWIKANSVDHHFYNTDSMLKTIELLLGMKPLSQYDAVADPIMDWDSSPSNDQPYTAVMPDKELFAQINPKPSDLTEGDPRIEMALRSEQFDLTHADAAPAREMDEIVWKTMKGPNAKMPSPRGLTDGKDDDD